MIAERLYQAIIDKVSEQGLEFEAVAKDCGFDPDVLLQCFDALPDSRPLSIFDFLGREQSETTARFLDCPRVRIFFLADVFTPNDVRALACGILGDKVQGHQDRQAVISNLARYLEDISRSNLFGRTDALLEEFTSAALASSLEEACQRTGIPFKKVEVWLQGTAATLSDLPILRCIADTIGIGITPALIATGIAQPGDFLWHGLPVDPMVELQRALDTDIW